MRNGPISHFCTFSTASLGAIGGSMNNYKLTLIGLALSVIVFLSTIILGVDIFELFISTLERFERFEIDEILIPIAIFGVFASIDMVRKLKANQITRQGTFVPNVPKVFSAIASISDCYHHETLPATHQRFGPNQQALRTLCTHVPLLRTLGTNVPYL